MTVKTCSHPACSCTVDAGEAFCSASCRESAARQDVRDLQGCECGHPTCLGSAGAGGSEALQRGAPGSSRPTSSG